MNRHRLLWLWLHESGLLERRGLAVLHVAPEWPLQRLLTRLPGVAYHGADLSSRLASEHFDLTAIPHLDGAFDLILCNHVLEHVSDDRAAMSELLRVLTPNGSALIMVPMARGRERTLEDPAIATAEERLRVYGQEDHVRLYGADFGRRLAEAGFAVRADRMLERLPAATVERQRLRPGNPRWEDDVIWVAARVPAPQHSI